MRLQKEIKLSVYRKVYERLGSKVSIRYEKCFIENSQLSRRIDRHCLNVRQQELASKALTKEALHPWLNALETPEGQFDRRTPQFPEKTTLHRTFFVAYITKGCKVSESPLFD